MDLFSLCREVPRWWRLSQISLVDYVVKFNAGFKFRIERCFNYKDIIIFSRRRIFTVRLGHRQKYPIVFDGFIREPQRSEHFAAPDFKPSKVVAVIGLSHIIRVAVDNAVGCAMTEHVS